MASKKIILTGATRGLGEAMARGLAKLGHAVIGCGRQPAHVEAMRQALPAPHEFAVVDVADDAAVQAWSAGVLARHGAPDLVLNNAAIMNEARPLWEIGAEEFGRLIDVNVKGVANVVRAFVPAMVARGAGVVVNFSSGWGRSVSPTRGPLLREQVRSGGADAGPGQGAAARPGGGAAQPPASSTPTCCAAPGATARAAIRRRRNGPRRRCRSCWGWGRATTASP